MCQFFINEVIEIISIKKGHRPPPNGGIPHALEPVIPGWSKEAFDLSASGQAAERRRNITRRYEDDEWNPEYISRFTEMGVKKEVFDADHDEGKFRYNVHTPMDIKEGERLPLLYVSHGGMGTPFQAENWGFSELIAKERFIAVYANNGGYSNENTDTEFPRILEAMIEKYPIDQSRVYAFGFSSGSDATETAATLWPEKIAACVPARDRISSREILRRISGFSCTSPSPEQGTSRSTASKEPARSGSSAEASPATISAETPRREKVFSISTRRWGCFSMAASSTFPRDRE